MELRSTRSRSKTPYLSTGFERVEYDKQGNHVEQHTVTKTMRRSTTRKIITEGSGMTSIEQEYTTSSEPLKISPKMRSQTRSDRTLRSSRFKTSDYSSEDGEIDGSTVNSYDQNIKNQLVEEARKRRSASNSSNSSQISALDVYRAAGDYWNKYPKTDWTYSQHSKDRIEIAPGVIAMPNMSRRSIHGNDSSTDYFDKQTNTSFSQDNVDESNYKRKHYSESYVSSNSKIKPRTLFNNNKYDYHVSSRGSTIQKRNVFYRFVSIFTSIFVSIYSWISSFFYYLYDKHNAGYVWFGKRVHKFVSRIMVLDTWLLQSSNTRKKKIGPVLALCLIPLLLLGGLHVLLANGVSLTPPCHPNCSRIASSYFNSFIDTAYDAVHFGKAQS